MKRGTAFYFLQSLFSVRVWRVALLGDDVAWLKINPLQVI